ncbi:hypothetical protein EXIGLDRAFT_768810 [Exidia glandulosa HHB12029]|uniref:Uncharacterized protein n=1 Tax=Exidia glandulosa HHB12029 TaxID=1314781 RepID=A0A165HXC6_EXIGL|nr:hypothetical protein EXIGLDRAFT_768810 [Exidia glandulosa HHB12029]
MSKPHQIITTQAEIDADTRQRAREVGCERAQTINAVRDIEQARKFEEHFAQQQAVFEAERLQWDSEQPMEAAAAAMRVQQMQQAISQTQAQMQNILLPAGHPAPAPSRRLLVSLQHMRSHRRILYKEHDASMRPDDRTVPIDEDDASLGQGALEIHLSGLSGKVAARALPVLPPTKSFIPLDLVETARKYTGMQKDGVILVAAHVNHIHDTVFDEMQKSCAPYAVQEIDP